jgi:hypothetical protein
MGGSGGPETAASESRPSTAGIPIGAGILYPTFFWHTAVPDHCGDRDGVIVGGCFQKGFAFARHSSLTGAQFGGCHQPVHVCPAARLITMKQGNGFWAFSWIVLMVAGTAVMGIGLYFIFLRPPLLPEDLRYMALSAAQLDIVRYVPTANARDHFDRIQITSTTSPPGGRTVSVSWSPAIATKRFCSVPFQFGKELPSTWITTLLSASFAEYVPK